MNYATIEKHASQLKSKAGELDKVIVDQKATILLRTTQKIKTDYNE
jgi:hypothetical protein